MYKQELINIFNKAKEAGKDIGVEVTIPGQDTTEIIINRNENIDNKLEFYKKAYDDNCVHCMNSQVKIIKAFAIGFFTRLTVNELVNKANTMNFGEAIKLLKQGKKMQREGWNGKKQYIELATNISYKNTKGEVINAEHEAIGNKAIAFVGTSGVQLGWLASQADMLAEDWRIVQ